MVGELPVILLLKRFMAGRMPDAHPKSRIGRYMGIFVVCCLALLKKNCKN
jgi:hypothetical protein